MNRKNLKLTRRDFLKLSGNLALLTRGGTLYTTVIEPLWLDIETVTLKLPRLPKSFSGFRLVQISDIHVGKQWIPSQLERVVETVISLQPDIVAITGDFVQASPDTTDEILALTEGPLAALSSQVPVYAVMGNHDHWWDVERVRNSLAKANVMELNNDFYTFIRDGESLHLCGVDDIFERMDDLDGVLSRLPDDGCAILLAHEPDFADTSAVTGRFDLQISGHSHGGQVIVPFVGPVVLPPHGRKYPIGLYKVGDMFQYTNRGLGMIFPYVRFMCRPEITIFNLMPA
ncbi:MAG TPA: metallophosphoesterase [Anaerolineales bacterium]|nr:metallophosphoesterase [Anaerolineales bacterium]